MVDIREMEPQEIQRIAEIDRSEHVTLFYTYKDGQLATEKVDWDVPRWFTEGSGEYTVQGQVQQWTPLLQQGGIMLGAFDGGLLVGVAILRPKLTGDMAQLAFLHVSRGYRRQGIAGELTAEVCILAQEAGARRLYVSATPSGSAVGFYRSQGFEIADQVHPELYALEPEDIHMIKVLTPEEGK